MIPTPYLIGGSVIAAIALAGYLYLKGHDAGQADIKSAVQTETIQRVERARIVKEKVDEEVRRTPYVDRVDSLQ